MIEVVRAAYREVHHVEPPPVDLREVERLVPAIAPIGDVDLLAEIARQYFAASGERPGDTFWADRGWPLHLLATQGIPTLHAKAARSLQAKRRDQLEADQRRSEEIASAERERTRQKEQAERRRRHEEAIAALPPHHRAWRLTVGELGDRHHEARLAAMLGKVVPELDGDTLIVRLEPTDLRLALARRPLVEQALAGHAGESPLGVRFEAERVEGAA